MYDEISFLGGQRLVNAVVMQAIEDYRHAVFYGNASQEEECAGFFRDICFDAAHVKRLKNGVGEFKKALAAYKFLPGKKRRSQVFKCPICGANAAFSFTRNKFRHAKCEGCGMSGTLIPEFQKSAAAS